MVTDDARPSPPVRGVHCPTCRRETVWTGNPHRPFCSLSCRLIDIGVWLDEGYRVESEDPPGDVP
jgi:endogenous inhibitor of DNA gyrase (YacG/DUF329 family)